MRTRWLYAIILVVALAVTSYPLAYSVYQGQTGASGPYLCAPLVPCSSPSAGVASCASSCTVLIANATYYPGTVLASPGARITWVNEDGFSHSATPFNATAWSGPLIPPGQSYTVTIPDKAQPGAYYYHCIVHPAMIGEVKVEG